MANIIFKVFFAIIKGIATSLLSGVNLLVANLLPNFASLLTALNNSITTFIGGGVTWFFSILPPITKQAVIIYLTFLVSYYTISITLHAILKIIHIIKRVKIW